MFIENIRQVVYDIYSEEFKDGRKTRELKDNILTAIFMVKDQITFLYPTQVFICKKGPSIPHEMILTIVYEKVRNTVTLLKFHRRRHVTCMG
jgi:hypothetical protein